MNHLVVWLLTLFLWPISQFSSKEWQANAGLYYYGFRFYEPNLQRWVNADPLGEAGGINLYRFVFNAPVNLIDPHGLAWMVSNRPLTPDQAGQYGPYVLWYPDQFDLDADGFVRPKELEFAIEGPWQGTDSFIGEMLIPSGAGLLARPNLLIRSKIPCATKAAQATKNSNLASPSRTKHILHGDKTGGGHLFPGKPGKTPFPKDWSGDRIMHEISDIATDPNAIRIPGRGGRTIARGTRDGVDIEVILESPARGGDIVTGYPTNLPRNP